MDRSLSLPCALRALLCAGLLLATLVTPNPATAGAPLGTPGPEGEVYLVRVGVASELLPDAGDDDRLILALEILRPGMDPEWIEVPESEGVSADASHFVLFEEASNTLFLVWQTRIGSHPIIKLASFRDGAWAEVTPVSDNVWNFKGHPQLAVTRDTFTLEEGEGTRTVERTLLHVAWWEQTLEGTRVLYRPLMLESGRLQGMGEVYVLNELVALSSQGPPAVDPAQSLLETPVLQSGRDSSSVVAGFVDAKTGQLVVAEIRLLPMGLGMLAEEIEDFIGGYDPETEEVNPGEGLRSLAGVVRGKILISGHRHRLNPRAVREFADEVHEGLLTGSLAAPSTSPPGKPPEPAEELRSLAGVVRGKILISGARIAGETLDRFNQAAAPGVLEMTTDDTETTGKASAAPHLVRTLLLSSTPAPEMANEALPYVFVSTDGAEVIVAWAEAEVLTYRKSTAGGWGEVRRMSLGEELSLTDALEIVRRSVQPVH